RRAPGGAFPMSTPTPTPPKLRGPQIETLTALLADAYSEDELEIRVRSALDVPLSHIVPNRVSFKFACYQLVLALERQGRAPESRAGRREDRPANRDLRGSPPRYFAAPLAPPAATAPAPPGAQPDDVVATLRELDANLSGPRWSLPALFLMIFCPLLVLLF